MRTKRRKIILFLVLFAAILAGYFILRVAFMDQNVPDSFSESRTKGAVIGQDIVNGSNAIVDEIAKINDLDKQKKYAEALKEVSTTRQTVEDIRGKAIDLSQELQIMTGALPGIRSEDARQAALDSISNHLALISRLITYTDEVDQLLAVLETHFKKGVNKSTEISRLVNDVNAEVRAINAFNSQAGMAMDRFENIVK